MDLPEIEQYLHQHIPLSRAMGVSVVSTRNGGVELSAPLEPNINHRDTVFGGSASALAILSGWTLIHLRLEDQGVHSRVVIQQNTVKYQKPMAEQFVAMAISPDPVDWDRFVEVLVRRGRARIRVLASLYCGGEITGKFEGVFVAFRTESAAP
ncbi:MAG: thioesterase domain-containing protein [Acidiferrobacteraceae bacterium]|jgi:thioesterase domain-containing protein